MKKTLAALAVLALTAGAAAAQEHHDRGQGGEHDRGGQQGGQRGPQGGQPGGQRGPQGGQPGGQPGGQGGGMRYMGPQGGGAPQGGQGGGQWGGMRYMGPQGGAPQGGVRYAGPQGQGPRGAAIVMEHRFDYRGGAGAEHGYNDHNDRNDRGRNDRGYNDRNDHGYSDRNDHGFDRRGGAGWARGDQRWDRHDHDEWHEGRSWSYRGRTFEAFHVRPYYWPSGYGYRTWREHEYLPFVFLNATWFLNNYYYYDLPAPPYGYRWVRYGPDALLVNVYTGEVMDVVYGVFYW